MRIAVCYIFPQLNLPVYIPAAQLFANSYLEHPPGITDHEIHVILCGGDGRESWLPSIFGMLPARYLPHNNFGRDIGGFQVAADVVKCDLLVCFGAHVHFHRDGWLDHMVNAYEDNGPGLYGAWGFHQPRPHLRTTAFWLPPELLSSYPHVIGDQFRYQFEHGETSITLWAQQMGQQTNMLTWNACLPQDEWRHITREESLFLDQHTG